MTVSLDQAFAHAPGDHRAFEQVARNLGRSALLRSPQPVTCPADPLGGRADRLRRFNLDDRVHRAHVDPELQRGGGDQTGISPGLELLLDLGPLLVGERTVMARARAGPPSSAVRSFRPGAGLIRFGGPSVAGAVRRFDPPVSLVEVIQPLGRRSAARRLLTKTMVEVWRGPVPCSSG